MSGSEYVDAITAEFGDRLGVADVTLDDERRATLSVGGLEVDLLHEEGETEMLWMMTSFGELSEDRQAPAFLLQLNFLSWLGDTMTLALDEDGDERFRVIGFVGMPVAMLSAESLVLVFQRFSQAALAIDERLAARDYSPLDGAIPTDVPTLPGGGFTPV